MDSFSQDVAAIKALGNLLSKKWLVRILLVIDTAGPCRFSDLKQRFDISSKMLTTTLGELTDADLLERHVHNTAHVTYTLSERGVELLAQLDALDVPSGHQREHAPHVQIASDHWLVGNLYAEWLVPTYEVSHCRLHELTSEHVESTDGVVIHVSYPETSQLSSVQSALTVSTDKTVVVAPTDRHLSDLAIEDTALLTIPVSKSELTGRLSSVLSGAVTHD